jgi:hypothetical protein
MYHYSNILRSEPITQKELNKTTKTNKIENPIKLDKSVDLTKTKPKPLFKHT